MPVNIPNIGIVSVAGLPYADAIKTIQAFVSQKFIGLEVFTNLDSARDMSVLLIGIVFFNLSNLSRISSEMKREDVYNYSNFPWFAKPPAYFKKEISNSSKYLRSKKWKNFWRTCFNAHLICVNHDDKVNIKKNNRLIYISKN